MFNIMELRVIRSAVHRRIEELKKRQSILDPESDDALDASSDLVVLVRILDKIKEHKEV